MYQALIATSKTLQQFVAAQINAEPGFSNPLSPFKVRGMGVRLNTPEEMTKDSHEGVSLWLYRIARDEQRLNEPPRRPTPNTIMRAPLPLRLHYLITPITSRKNDGDPETEQYLMGKVLQVFHSRPRLCGADLKAELAGTEAEIHIRLESLPLDEISLVWQALEGSYQLSVSYEVSVVNVDSSIEPEGVTPVTTVLPNYGLITG